MKLLRLNDQTATQSHVTRLWKINALIAQVAYVRDRPGIGIRVQTVNNNLD